MCEEKNHWCVATPRNPCPCRPLTMFTQRSVVCVRGRFVIDAAAVVRMLASRCVSVPFPDYNDDWDGVGVDGMLVRMVDLIERESRRVPIRTDNWFDPTTQRPDLERLLEFFAYSMLVFKEAVVGGEAAVRRRERYVVSTLLAQRKLFDRIGNWEGFYQLLDA